MKIAFMFAHLDDESFGPAGTISKLCESNEVTIVSLCKGNRPGNEHVKSKRLESFYKACDYFGAKPIVFNNSDCTLTLEKCLSDVEFVINEIQPEIVFTNNISDIHRDHRIVSESVMVACRPKPNSSVKQLYMCEIPASTEWSMGQIEPIFIPNYFVNVDDYMHKKKFVLSLYDTETYSYPDARSEKSMIVLSEQRGKQVGYNHAESFKMIYNLQ
jgi:LmbE family N-acetylglucosaminyl deacetylase